MRPTDGAPTGTPGRAPHGGPWRTEGMPAGADGDGRGTGGKRPKAAWIRFFTTLAAVYLVVFGLTWLTDGRGAAAVPYTSFTRQVAADNVKEVYSRGETIEGTLKKARQVPGGSKGDTYTTFTTERPVFADDDIYAQMVDKEVVVRAEPVTQQRGLLANLFWALLPVLLFGLFWYWLLRKGPPAPPPAPHRRSPRSLSARAMPPIMRTGDAQAPEAADGGEEETEGDGGSGGSRDARGPRGRPTRGCPGEADGGPSGQQ